MKNEVFCYKEKYRLPWKLQYWETYGQKVLVNCDDKLIFPPFPSQDLDVEFILFAANNMPKLLGLKNE